LLFILGALYYFPLFYPFIQNDILAPPPPIYVETSLGLPYYLTKPENNTFTSIFVKLTTDTDFIVGKPLNLLISALMPSSLVANSPSGFEIIPDDALFYPVLTIPAAASATPASILMKAGSQDNPAGTTEWSGNGMIEYTVTGSFGLTLVFLNYTYLNWGGGKIKYLYPIGNLHTSPLFSIASQDSFVLKRSQSLTMTLTFLLLFFVVLDLVRIEKNPEYKNHIKNGSKTIESTYHQASSRSRPSPHRHGSH
jgi:hypothetical protein